MQSDGLVHSFRISTDDSSVSSHDEAAVLASDTDGGNSQSFTSNSQSSSTISSPMQTTAALHESFESLKGRNRTDSTPSSESRTPDVQHGPHLDTALWQRGQTMGGEGYIGYGCTANLAASRGTHLAEQDGSGDAGGKTLLEVVLERRVLALQAKCQEHQAELRRQRQVAKQAARQQALEYEDQLHQLGLQVKARAHHIKVAELQHSRREDELKWTVRSDVGAHLDQLQSQVHAQRDQIEGHKREEEALVACLKEAEAALRRRDRQAQEVQEAHDRAAAKAQIALDQREEAADRQMMALEQRLSQNITQLARKEEELKKRGREVDGMKTELVKCKEDCQERVSLGEARVRELQARLAAAEQLRGLAAARLATTEPPLGVAGGKLPGQARVRRTSEPDQGQRCATPRVHDQSHVSPSAQQDDVQGLQGSHQQALQRIAELTRQVEDVRATYRKRLQAAQRAMQGKERALGMLTPRGSWTVKASHQPPTSDLGSSTSAEEEHARLPAPRNSSPTAPPLKPTKDEAVAQAKQTKEEVLRAVPRINLEAISGRAASIAAPGTPSLAWT